MYIIGSLPPVTPRNETYLSNFRYILTYVDQTTRWMEATPMTDNTFSTVVITLLNSCMTIFCVPLYVVIDLSPYLKVNFSRNHPKLNNGIIGCQLRTLKASLMFRKQNWFDALPIILLAM